MGHEMEDVQQDTVAGCIIYILEFMRLPRSEIDVYAKALSTSLVQKSVEHIIPLVLAKAGYEKRRLTSKFFFL
jgi:hypothetical protein